MAHIVCASNLSALLGANTETEIEMRKLSTGDDATLGNYRKLSAAVFGEDSKAVEFLDGKIAESPNGEDEEVLVDEGQMVHLLGSMAFGA